MLNLGFSGFLLSAMVIPLSLDFAASLGQSATASGLYMGLSLIAGVLGTIIGRPLISETAWSQFFVRRLLITIFSFSTFMSLVLACFYNWTAKSNEVSFIWWTGIVATCILNSVSSIPMIALTVLWTKATHPGNRTVWSFLGQCARSAGMTVGPVVFSLMSRGVIAGGEPVSPRSMMAWVYVYSVGFTLVSLTVCTFLMPTELPPVLPPAAPTENEGSASQVSGEARPEELDEPDRQTVYWKMVAHFGERPFTLAAVEVSTTMMLEVLYGWDAYHCGFCFTVMCPVGIVLAVVTKVMINTGYLQESSVYFSSMIASVIGCALLFDEGHAGPATLIAAGTVIYTGALGFVSPQLSKFSVQEARCPAIFYPVLGAALANSIADGWGARAAKEGTSIGQAGL